MFFAFLSAFFIFTSSWLNAQSDVTGVSKSTSADTSIQQCTEFLQRTRAGFALGLQSKIEKLEATEKCLAGKKSNCESEKQDVLDEISKLTGYRSDLGALDISYSRTDRDFLMVSNINSGVRNHLGESVNRLSAAEEQEAWKSFESYQKEFIQEWAKSNSQGKSDLWKKCFAHKGGELSLGRFRQSHLFLPEANPNPPRQYRQACEKEKRFWLGAPFSNELVHSYRSESRPEVNSEAKNMEPWMFLIEDSLNGKNSSEKVALAAKGHNRLIAELKKLSRWVERLPDHKLYKLLDVKGLTEPMLQGHRFCEDFPRGNWVDLAKEIGLSLIPGFDMMKVLFHEQPLNNQMFLAGFIDHENWQNSNSELRRRIAASGFQAVPQAALEGVVVASVLGKLAKPLARLGQSVASGAKKLQTNFTYRPGKKFRFHLTEASKDHIDGHVMDAEKFSELDSLLRNALNKPGQVDPETIRKYFNHISGVDIGRGGRSTTLTSRDFRREVFANIDNAVVRERQIQNKVAIFDKATGQQIVAGNGQDFFSADKVPKEYLGEGFERHDFVAEIAEFEYSDAAGEVHRFIGIRCVPSGGSVCVPGSGGVPALENEQLITFFPTCGSNVLNVPSADKIARCAQPPAEGNSTQWKKHCRRAMEQALVPCN